MTDRELLELAAKAAGIECDTLNMISDPYLRIWNPLTDDGDALRLAVKLKLDVISDLEGDCVSVWSYGNPDVNVKYGDHPYTATRRAIVRAAAAIGEKL